MSFSIGFFRHAGNWQVEEQFKTQIKSLLEVATKVYKTSEIYFMKEGTAQYASTKQNHLYVFTGATPGPHTKEDYILDVNGNLYAIQWLKVQPTDYATVIADEKDQVLAYFSQKHNELYIPFDIDGLDKEVYEEIILYILGKFKELHLDEIANKDSWKLSKQKEELKQRVEKYLSKGKEIAIRELERSIQDATQYIEDYTRALKNKYDVLVKYKKDLEKEKSSEVTGLDAFFKGLDQVAEHPKVSNVLVDKDLITIYVDDVYAYADVNGDEEAKFYIGNMHMKINITNTEIHFFGDNGRRGYWTDHDPHPHVDGSTGKACLGNVATTIAELCSQKEIYPLFLVCLDFLENANTDDPAGKKVVKWDRIGEDGEVIPYEPECHCEYCEEAIEDGDEWYTVYTSFNYGDLGGAETWCEGCRENNAGWNDHVDEVVADDIYDEINEYYDEDEECDF